MELKKSITSYLKMEYAKYAIQIDGEWGKGKTYFWENELVGIAKDLELKPIYFSLNGITELNDLKANFYMKFIPLLNTKESNDFSKILGKVTGKITEKFFGLKPQELLSSLDLSFINFSKYVVCFDDYERCGLKQKELLGFINGNIEHHNLKTIIFSNEKEIEEGEKKFFFKHKEKTIGRIFQYSPKLEVVLESIIEQYKKKDKEFVIFLKRNSRYLLDLLNENKVENLRTTIFIIEILLALFSSSSKGNLKGIEENIILFVSLVSFEFKLGKITGEDYKSQKLSVIDERYYNTFANLSIDMDKKEENENISYEISFCKKYLSTRIKSYVFFQSIYKFILSGYLDISEFQKEVSIFQEKVKRKPEPKQIAYSKIINYSFRELSQQDFNENFKIVYENAKSGNYSIYDYPSINKFFIFFSQNAIINKPEKTIKNVLISGIKKAKKDQVFDDFLFDSFIKFDNSLKKDKVYDEFCKSQNQLKKEKYKQLSNQFIVSVDESIQPMIDFFKNHQIDSPFMEFVNIDELFNKLTNSSTKVIFNFAQLMDYKYGIVNIKEYLFRDRRNIVKLSNKIKKYLNNGKIDSLIQFNLNELIKSLDSISDKLK